MNFAPTTEHINFAEEKRVLMISGGKRLKNPKDENYWDMLMFTFCPSWEWISLTMLLIVAITAMFVAECIYGISANNTEATLLQISRATLIKFGAILGPLVHSGQVYRLLSAMFVHLDFMHYIGNIFATFILVSRIEYTFGVFRTLIMFIISGIGGNIFTLAVDVAGFSTVKGGASTALYGMIGVILGYIIINWQGLRLIGDGLRCSIMCSFMFLLIFVLIFTPTQINDVDYLGHLGGFLTGLWISAIGTPLISETRETTIRIAFIILLIAQFLGTFLAFYLNH